MHESFNAQMSAFPGADAVSLPGHPEGTALASVADCAVWLAKYLRWKGVPRAVIGGNSLGGAVALEFALRYPELTAGLILIGTGARLKVTPAIFDMIDRQWPECIPQLAAYALSEDAAQDLRARVERWHHTVGAKSTRTDYAACNAFDVMERLGGIAAPTLIVVGDRDVMTPPKYATFLQERIDGSRLAIIEGAGHMAHAERPDVVNEHIREHVNGLM